MEGGAVRLLHASAKPPNRLSIILVALFVLPTISPLIAVNAEARIESQDFEILSDLSEALDNRQSIIESDSVSQLADPILDQIELGVGPTGVADPLHDIEEVLDEVSLIETAPPIVVHPDPYLLLTDEDSRPPGEVTTIWSTLFNLTDYVIWTRYTDKQGNEVENFETITFLASLLSLLDTETDALLHQMDIDNDGDDDIQVGLSIDLNDPELDGATLSVAPQLDYKVSVLDSSLTDSDWEDLDTLEVSLMKAFAYSDGILSEGESYVWVIDSHFTHTPYDFTLGVGLERFYFDISGAGSDLVISLFNALTFGAFGGSAGESGISIASISAPYQISIDNQGQVDCPEDYSPIELMTLPSHLIGCGVTAGFGYVHFSPPDSQGERDVWEVAYIEAAVHPNGLATKLPNLLEVTIRTDSTLADGTGDVGENGLTTVEYWADRKADLHLHFHENRSEVPPEYSDGIYGNVTDSVGWLRGLPAGSLDLEEIDRVFTMLGSKSEPQLPGGQPERLGLIIAVKNFTRDTSQNVDDRTLPINPAYPPKSLVLFRSVDIIEEVEYHSWIKRGGSESDHRRIAITAKEIPTAVVFFGSFEIGGAEKADVSLDSSQNLDFMSRIFDTVLINIVDLFLDIGTILNDIPSVAVEVISGGVGGDSGILGSKLHLLMHDDWSIDRTPTSIAEIGLQIGSSPHPTTSGDHLILSTDRSLDFVQGRSGQNEPLVRVAASLHLSGLSSFSLIDDAEINTQEVSLITDADEEFNFIYIDHKSNNLSEAFHQGVSISDIPDNISAQLNSDGATYLASSSIDRISYTGIEGKQRQAAHILGLPASFEFEFGDVTKWSSSSPISTIHAQMTNSSDPVTMSGDHFLFHNQPSDGSATISARISGLQEVGWISPMQEGADGPLGRGTAFMTALGDRSMSIDVEQAPTEDGDSLSAIVLIDPLPSTISVEIPTGSESGNNLAIPELNTTQGVSGVAFFLGGFAELGASINQVMGGVTSDISTGEAGGNGSFSYGMELDANSNFDLIFEAKQGNGSVDAPSWVHGISVNAAVSGIADGFHVRGWIPNLPPQIDLSVTRTPNVEGQNWSISIGLEDWKPARPEFMINAQGINGQDVMMTLNGLEVNKETDLLIDSDFKIRDTSGGITEVTTSTHYYMSNRLEWIHALLINREAGARTELMINDIPQSIDLRASLGTSISMDMTVPEEYRIDGPAVDSIMMQQMQWMDGSWWPATIFLTDVPNSINLTTEPDLDFDITKNIAFQGTPVLDFSASDSGMSLYIEASGRAINNRGDIILLAQGLSDRMAIKPTDDFGLAIRSGGDGVEMIYIRISNVPATPPLVLEEMEALGENLRSATIHIREIAGPYSVIEIDEVQGGRIIASARASAEIEALGTTFDLRGVLLDAQSTGGVPTGTSLGVNGLASDLSLLNLIPGFEGTTHHIIAPEPFSSGVLTLFATFIGGS
tara:strand:- start:3389 stop:7759 length:4371 start_codon:yes stop_codon:yes gene_type:complete